MKAEMSTENTGLGLEEFSQILKENKLKVTQPRLRVLEVISTKTSAISQPELGEDFRHRDRPRNPLPHPSQLRRKGHLT